MKIIVQTNKIKCDMGICKNKADYSVVPDGAEQNQYINICSDCMQKLHSACAKILVPKSPKNIYTREKRGDK